MPRIGPGRPRIRPDRALGDKAYSSRANRSYLRRRGIRCTIPEPADQIRHRKNRGRASGRPPAFDPERYKAPPRGGMRDQPAQTQPGRGHRFDKLAVRYEATVHIAAINE